jgi:hypothetical protein
VTPLSRLIFVGAGPAGLGVYNDQIDVHDALGFRMGRQPDLREVLVAVLGVEQLRGMLVSGSGNIGRHDEAIAPVQRTCNAQLDQSPCRFMTLLMQVSPATASAR